MFLDLFVERGGGLCFSYLLKIMVLYRLLARDPDKGPPRNGKMIKREKGD